MSNKLLDIHTHHNDGTPGEAIVNMSPSDFFVEPGRWYSVGVHPWQLIDAMTDDMAKLYELAVHPQVLAIGETGFDRLKHFDYDVQMMSFQMHSFLSEENQKPLVIHAVRATDLLLLAMKELEPEQPWIIHGFRGNPIEAKQLLNAGFYLSYGERYNVFSLRNTPLDRLFLETDEADIDIHELYNKVAEDLHLEEEELLEEVQENIEEVFSVC